MSAPLPELPPELTRLFESDRRDRPMPSAARGRVWGSLAAALTATAAPQAAPRHLGVRQLGHAVAGALRRQWIGLAAGVALGGSAGAGLQAWHDRVRSGAVLPPMPAHVAPSADLARATTWERPPSPPSAPVPSVGVRGIAPPVPIAHAHRGPNGPAVPAPSVAPAGPVPDEGASGDLERERTLLDTARAALARGDAQGSMALLARHREAFPDGQFAEEAAALRIQSLSTLGAAREAHRSALAFRAKYPKSLLLPALAPALAPAAEESDTAPEPDAPTKVSPQ